MAKSSRIDKLIEEYENYQKIHGIKLESADSSMLDDNLDKEHRDYCANFSARWEIAENLDRVAAEPAMTVMAAINWLEIEGSWKVQSQPDQFDTAAKLYEIANLLRQQNGQKPENVDYILELKERHIRYMAK